MSSRVFSWEAWGHSLLLDLPRGVWALAMGAGFLREQLASEQWWGGPGAGEKLLIGSTWVFPSTAGWS